MYEIILVTKKERSIEDFDEKYSCYPICDDLFGL
jgi:hypothetical protein